MSARTTITTLVVAAAIAVGTFIGAAPASAAIQPAPTSCGLPWSTAKCTEWRAYMDARLNVVNLSTRRDAVALILSASGTKDWAYKAGVASTKAGRCNQQVTNQTLALLDEQYKRGVWASNMTTLYSKGLNIGKLPVAKVGPVNLKAPWLTWVYGPVADKTIAAAKTTGLRLFARGQSTVVLSNFMLCR